MPKPWFSNETVELDGQTFRDCTFDTCVLIYRGGQPPEISNCLFPKCEWRLEDAADRTLDFFGLLHRIGADDVVREVIATILKDDQFPLPPSEPFN
jgi:hypothetical protein